jgi:hypothetical protein
MTVGLTEYETCQFRLLAKLGVDCTLSFHRLCRENLAPPAFARERPGKVSDRSLYCLGSSLGSSGCAWV